MTRAVIDDEDLTVKCCAPLSALTAPVEVGGVEYVLMFPVVLRAMRRPKMEAISSRFIVV